MKANENENESVNIKGSEIGAKALQSLSMMHEVIKTDSHLLNA